MSTDRDQPRPDYNRLLAWLPIVTVLFLGAIQWGQFQAALGAIEALSRDVRELQIAKELLDQKLVELDRRGTERTAARDASIADVRERLKAQELITQTIQLQSAREYEGLKAELRAIREGLGLPPPSSQSTYPPAPALRPDLRG